MQAGQPWFVDRTVRLLQELVGQEEKKARESLLKANVGLTAAKSSLASTQGRMLAALTVNLLARTFAQVRVLPPLAGRLLDRLGADFEKLWGFPLDAIGAGRIVEATRCDLLLAIGEADNPRAYSWVVTIGSSGWICEYEHGPGPLVVNDPPNPVGAAVSASMGVAQVFAKAVEPSVRQVRFRNAITGPRCLRWSALSYRRDDTNHPLPSQISLDHVVMVGMGGVGAAVETVLAWTSGLRGTITLVDPDRLEESNLNRFLPAPRTAAGQLKVEVARHHIESQQPNLKVLSAPITYQEFVRRIGRPRGTAVSTIDDEEVRAFIQTDLPRVVIDGATSGATIGVSRHTFLDGACLGCLHPRTEQLYSHELQMARLLGWSLGTVIERLASDEPLSPHDLRMLADRLGLGEDLQFREGKPLRVFWAEDVCGRLELPAEITPLSPSGSAAFVSTMAGALVAGELLKDASGMMPLDNEFRMQVFQGPTDAFPRKRPKDPKCRCFCSEDAMRLAYLEIHSRREGVP